VVLVTERHWLLAHYTRFGQVIGTKNHREQPTHDGKNEDCAQNGDSRDGVGAAVKDLGHFDVSQARSGLCAGPAVWLRRDWYIPHIAMLVVLCRHNAEDALIQRGGNSIWIDRLRQVEPSKEPFPEFAKTQSVLSSGMSVDCVVAYDNAPGSGGNLQIFGLQPGHCNPQHVIASTFRQFRSWRSENFAFRAEPVVEFRPRHRSTPLEQLESSLLNQIQHCLHFGK
jgi:hypothetical protein